MDQLVLVIHPLYPLLLNNIPSGKGQIALGLDGRVEQEGIKYSGPVNTSKI